MRRRRELGTMIAYGFARGHLETDLAIAARIGAEVIEALPDWRRHPDPVVLAARVAEVGIRLHSAHGPWGSQAIEAMRVDLADLDATRRQASIDDVRRALDWLVAAGGTHLVVHPGSLSASEEADRRRDALARSLAELSEHARGSKCVVCVENMPPGVFPGSETAELAGLLDELGRPEFGLALDTGHGHLNDSAAAQTLRGRGWLRSTHVHDNDGRFDAHLPPGLGTIDWRGWRDALDRVDYEGPVMLECIRHLREHPECITACFLELLEFIRGNAEAGVHSGEAGRCAEDEAS